MNTINVTIKDRLAIITLNRGRSNAMNREMVAELTDILQHTSNDENIGGVILSGRENFFSAGLDLIELYDYNEEEISSFWKLFLNLVAKIVAFKKPIVAAINGHSPAGGCVLALACDARVMAEGNFIIGLNEVPVGIIVPNSIFQLYAFWLGKAAASRSLLEGKLFSPEEALQIGLVDELVNPASIMTAAERSVRKYMAIEPNTWQHSKVNIREELIEITGGDHSDTVEKLLVQWWSASSRNIQKMIIDNLQKK